MDSVEKNAKEHCREYVEALEIERMKMLMFQRELPLSIELVSRAIESYRQELPVDPVVAGGRQEDKPQQQQPESSEETSSDGGPVLEFIPIRKWSSASSSESEKNEQDEVMKDCGDVDKDSEVKSGTKSDWLRSVQLWNQTPDLPPESEDLPRNDLLLAKNVMTSSQDEASEPYIKEKSVEKSQGQTDSSSAETKESQKSGGSKNKEDKDHRKQRRCWSQELHRRFLNSLQQLGGAHVATPKQIRELMKVDGLTNDEVKSHLQKYRLHTRRPTPPILSNGRTQSGHPQFVVVGGIWVPPSDRYPTMTASPAVAVGREANGVFSGAKSGVYTPMAAPPAPSSHTWQPVSISRTPKAEVSRTSDGHVNHGDGVSRCVSPSMSSNTRTTASPVF